jgi:hypothetical protein
MSDEKKIDDGGPVHPCDGFGQFAPHYGMSLRDYFAGQALQGIANNEATWSDIAKSAYAAADAMLAARNKHHTG